MSEYRTHLGMPAAPGATLTVTLFNNYVNDGPAPNMLNGQGRLCFAIQSSHDSAASGVICESSSDGANWYACADGLGGSYPKSYTATGKTLYDVPVQGIYMRATYTNSNNVLTAWHPEGWLEPDRASL